MKAKVYFSREITPEKVVGFTVPWAANCRARSP